MKKVKIGCSSGFWGDSPHAARQLVEGVPDLQYLVADYLAEVTMCILARAKSKQSGSKGAGEGGFVKEFLDTVYVPLMEPILKRGIKIVTNAGGMNPLALKYAIEKATQAAKLPVPVVAAIYGDDILDKAYDFKNSNKFEKFRVDSEDEPLWADDKILMSCNVYTGAFPIAEALKEGAQIVITGRCVDSAIVLGPLLFEFGWNTKQLDLLSSGSLAGHIIECGTQCTGGNFTDWKLSYQNGWDNVGYPVLVYYEDGTFDITKPPNTGGLVSIATVSEQLLYEIHDPSMYILPDVVCDWTNVSISQKDINVVNVKGAKGKSPTKYFKVAATTFGGFKLSAMLMIGGTDAKKKANAVALSVVERSKRLMSKRGFNDYQQVNIEILGSDHLYGPNGSGDNSKEVLLRIAVRHENQKALSILATELAPAALSMAPGITGSFDSGRPTPIPVIWYYSCLLPKEEIIQYINIDKEVKYTPPPVTYATPTSSTSLILAQLPKYDLNLTSNKVLVPLISICYGRSGDKGDTCNIGIIARKHEYYAFLVQELTEEKVYNHLKHLVKGSVTRFYIPSLSAFNFVLTKSLGGGGVSSLNMDRQGKTYAQILLAMKIYVPSAWFPSLVSNY